MPTLRIRNGQKPELKAGIATSLPHAEQKHWTCTRLTATEAVKFIAEEFRWVSRWPALKSHRTQELGDAWT